MRNVLLFTLIFLLSGCSFESFLALGEVDKVQVVKQNASLSHYRAYFTRSQLKPIVHHKKYIYFYNKKKKDLAILLHRYDTYYLYSLYHPNAAKIVMNSHKKTRYKDIKKTLKRKGYRVTSPASIAAISKVALRRYKGIKTLLVEIKDYRALQSRYRHAIKTYDANLIKHIKTKLPHAFIASYYHKYAQLASTKDQQQALKIIASKLHLDKPEQTSPDEEKEVQETLAKEVPEERKNTILEQPSSSFSYYAQEASLHELDTYLKKKNTRNTLSFNQYTTLQKRHTLLKEETVLKEGSLAELIALYKTNKSPKYKKRILELMKEVQE